MRRIGMLLLSLIAALLLASGVALAAGPAHSETLRAGPYIVDVNLFQYPPITDQAVEVTVVPHASGLHLSGRIALLPGLGTDAVPLYASLTPLDSSGALKGSIRLPVRGAWTVQVQLNGPAGSGQASFPIVVAAPGAIPIWLAWLIAVLPLLGIAWLVWQQYRYRRSLLFNAK